MRLKLGIRLHLGVFDFLISCGDLKMKKGPQVDSHSNGLKVTYVLPIYRIQISSSLKHPWGLCSKSLELYRTHLGLKQNGWHFDGILKCTFFESIKKIKFGSSGKCWDHYPCTIPYFSVHCYSFTETKLSLVWLNCVILGTCSAASNGNFVKRRLRCRFWKLCTRISNPGTRYSNGFHWLVWWYGARILAPVMANGPHSLWCVCGSYNS